MHNITESVERIMDDYWWTLMRLAHEHDESQDVAWCIKETCVCTGDSSTVNQETLPLRHSEIQEAIDRGYTVYWVD